MADMVRAVVQTGPRQMEMREYPRPVLGPTTGAVLRVEACGICGSDVEQYKGAMGTRGLPMIPGHEPLGIRAGGAVQLWDVETGQRRRLLTHAEQVTRAYFSADGRRLLSAAGTAVRLWDVATGDVLFTLPHDTSVREAALSPSGNRVLTCADGEEEDESVIRLWDGASGTALTTPDVFLNKPVRQMTFFPDGRSFLTRAARASA